MTINNDITKLLTKFFRDRCSQDELNKLIVLVNETNDQKMKSIMKNLWDSNIFLNNEDAHLSVTEMDSILGTIHDRIDFNKSKKSRSNDKITLNINYFTRIAAVLILPLLVTVILILIYSLDTSKNSKRFVTIETPKGARVKTVLPDGTIVWQNSASKLKYSTDFSSTHRSVTLDGEAYFYVVSDEKHPFFVLTKAGRVKVTGTCFNVNTYDSNKFTSVFLVEGKLNFKHYGADKSYKIEEGDIVKCSNDSDTFFRERADSEKITSWRTGKLIFRNDPLYKVIAKLNNWYNVDIKIDLNDELYNLPFTMTIIAESIDQVLKNIKYAAPIKIETIYNKSSEVKEYIITNK